MMFCEKCKVQNKETSNFCNNCGAPLVKKSRNNKKIWIIIILSFLLFCVVGTVLAIQISANSAQKKYQQRIDLGNKYLEELDYEMAILSFESAMEVDPKKEEVYIALANTYLLMDDVPAAMEILETGYVRTASPVIQEKKLEVKQVQKAERQQEETEKEIAETQVETQDLETEESETAWDTAEKVLEEDFLANQELANLIDLDITLPAGDFTEVLEKPVGTGVISAKLYDLDGDENPELILVYYDMIEGEKCFVVDLYTWDEGKFKFVENLVEERAHQSYSDYYFYTCLFIRETEDKTYLCWFDKSAMDGDPTRYYFYQYKDGEVKRDSLVEGGYTDITIYILFRNDEEIYMESAMPEYNRLGNYSSYEEAINSEMEKLGFKEEYFTLDDEENEYICFIEYRRDYDDNAYHSKMIDYTGIRETGEDKTGTEN